MTAFWISGIVIWAVLAQMGWKIIWHWGGEASRDHDEAILMQTAGAVETIAAMRRHNIWSAANPAPDYGIFHIPALIAVIPLLALAFAATAIALAIVGSWNLVVEGNTSPRSA